MKVTKLNNIQGFCSNCGKQIDTGYLYQANNGEAFKVVCEDCFLAEQQENKTIQHLTVKEQPQGLLAFIFGLFGAETRIFKVMNCEDVLLSKKYITASELLSLQKQGVKVKIYK